MIPEMRQKEREQDGKGRERKGDGKNIEEEDVTIPGASQSRGFGPT